MNSHFSTSHHFNLQVWPPTPVLKYISTQDIPPQQSLGLPLFSTQVISRSFYVFSNIQKVPLLQTYPVTPLTHINFNPKGVLRWLLCKKPLWFLDFSYIAHLLIFISKEMVKKSNGYLSSLRHSQFCRFLSHHTSTVSLPGWRVHAYSDTPICSSIFWRAHLCFYF